MDNQKPKSYETTAFEILNHEQLHCYDCDFQQAGFEQTKDIITKHIDILLYTEENQRLIFMTNKEVMNKSLTFVSHGQRVDVNINELNLSAEKKVSLFMDHAIGENDNILKVKDDLYFLPFESFYTIAKRDDKSKIFPFFKYEIINCENRVVIAFKLVLYSQNYPNLDKAMKEEQVLKSNDLRHLVVPLFNYKSNFLTFEGKGDRLNLSTSEYFNQFDQNPNDSDLIVKLGNLDNEDIITVPAKYFNLISRLEFNSFIKEKIYLLLKLKKVILNSNFMKKAEIKFDNTTYKPDLAPAKFKEMLNFELQLRSDTINISDWMFICNKSDIEIGGKLAKDVSMAIKSSLRIENFKPPKAYTVVTKEDQSAEDSMMEGIQNKLTDDINLVVVLINKQNACTNDIEQFLLANNKRYIIYEMPALLAAKNYFQTKVDEFYISLGTKYEGRLSNFDNNIQFSFNMIKQTSNDNYLYLTDLSIDRSNLDINRKILKVTDEDMLINTVTSQMHPDILTFKFIKGLSTHKEAFTSTENVQYVFVSESNFTIFPNININSYYAESLLNFQNYHNLVSSEIFFKDKDIEESYENCFVISKLDKHNVIILDHEKSYRLTFVNKISELHMPKLRQLFLLVKAIRGDFAYFFK